MISRRRVLGGALLCACHSLPRFAFATSWQVPAEMIVPLQEFARGAVKLGAGPMFTQFEQQQALYLGIDDDRLLKPFRVRAGLPAPGADMGGWYDQSSDFNVDPNDWGAANWHGFIPGHSFGQYLSGLARGYATTGDARTKKKVAGLVVKFATTISPRFFDDYNLPAYTYDKLVVGLIDAYHLAGVVEAKDALGKLTDAVLLFLPDKAETREERRARPHRREAQIWDEPYTLPENLYLAAERGMGDRYRDIAARYVANDSLFDALAKEVSPFKGKHAYSHVNALSSAIQAYLATDDLKYFQAAQYGFAFVQAQSYATGGWGPNEELVAEDDHETLYTLLKDTHRSFETPCGAYAHFKITRSLLRLSRRSDYGDSMERVLYNTILGAKPTLPDGSTFYYSDYNELATKFFRMKEPWPCCSGTFIQVTADYGISAYLLDKNAIYVNLYVPSEIQANFSGRAVKITQTTAYPLANTTRLSVDVARPTEFGLQLRIPRWAGKATSVKVNGKPESGVIKAGRFFELRRSWKRGDGVEVMFDMGLRLEPLNEAHPEMVAVMTGPLVLFPIEAPATSLSREEWLSAKPVARDQWVVTVKNERIRLKPFMSIGDETYRLYNRLRESEPPAET